MEDIIKPDNSKDDKFEYDVKDENILDVSSNGTMNPKNDGHTQVKIKKNGKDIADVDVEVKDGKIAQVTLNKENEEENATVKKENTTKEKVKKKSVTEGSMDINPFIIFFIIIAILIIYIVIKFYNDKDIKQNKKNRKNRRKNNKKKERKNEKIS